MARILIISLSLLTFLNFSLGENELRCPLQWFNTTTGAPFPGKVVTSDTFHYPVRGYSNGFDVGGNLIISQDENSAFFSSNGKSVTLDNFQILMNPYDCDLKWIEEHMSPYHPVSIDESSRKVIGRARFENSWYSGEVDVATKTISFSVGHGDAIRSNDYQILSSYSSGLTLELRDFKYDKNVFESGTDFMGLDEIRNEANTDVVQRVTHFKQVKESWKVTVSVRTTHTKTTTKKVRILFWTKTKTTTEVTTSLSVHSEMGGSETTPITVIREIHVPPFTSVEACSVINIVHNPSVPYEATAIYTVKGWTGDEIKEFLTSEGIDAEEIGSDHVKLATTGELGLSMAVNTKFFVGPLNSWTCLRNSAFNSTL